MKSELELAIDAVRKEASDKKISGFVFSKQVALEYRAKDECGHLWFDRLCVCGNMLSGLSLECCDKKWKEHSCR